jgi:hypothetical protein
MTYPTTTSIALGKPLKTIYNGFMTIGRPTVMTPEIIALLEEAFLIGASDKEACFKANIGTTTLYDYCKENPDFAERKEELKEAVKYRARYNIAKAINEGDKALSQWYAERKMKDEFSSRTETTGKDGAPLVEQSPELAAITAMLNEHLKRDPGASITGDGGTASAVGTETQNQE